MADVRKLKPFILKWEGGFVDDPADLGEITGKRILFCNLLSMQPKTPNNVLEEAGINLFWKKLKN